MNAVALGWLLLTGVGVVCLPRQWAALALIAGGCYPSRLDGVDLGPFTFTALRLLAVIGLLRVTFRREWPKNGSRRLDALIAVWGAYLILSSGFHSPPWSDIVYRVRLAAEGIALYAIFRAFCQSRDDLRNVLTAVAVSLLPIAVGMVTEQLTGQKVFAIFGSLSEADSIRNERFRAQGPFGNAILAGTVGAVCIPFMVALWSRRRVAAITGLAACVGIVSASFSSGPIVSAVAAVGALLLWSQRRYARWGWRVAICGYVLLDLAMKAPAYYLIARVDFTGGSAGYHRARLIESAMDHFNEWWIAGTNYTRHWMPTGLEVDPNHTDITNHYLAMGVLGGVPLMILFMMLLFTAFRAVGTALKAGGPDRESFAVWCIGAALFAHAVTLVSVSYFDQSIVFLYLTFAAAQAVGCQAGAAETVASTRQRWRGGSTRQTAAAPLVVSPPATVAKVDQRPRGVRAQ